MTRRVTLTLLLALCALFAGCDDKGKPASESAAESSGLKITAWNLQWFPGKTPSGGTAAEQAAHVSAVISELKAIDADIVLLQEIREPAALQEIIKAIPEYSLDVVSDFQDVPGRALTLFLVKTTLENASALCTDLLFPNFL